MTSELIECDILKSLLDYVPETGQLFWLTRGRDMFSDDRHWKAWNSRFSGREAFTADVNGYQHGSIFNVSYRAHRVAWAIFYGSWPEGDVDHINGDPKDNRICNLRTVSHIENMRNQKRRTTNTSGTMGVYWSGRLSKWVSRIAWKGKDHHIGVFDHLADAITARKEAERKIGFHPNHGNR